MTRRRDASIVRRNLSIQSYRENEMNQSVHRLGVSEARLVKRALKLKPCDQGDLDAAIREIDEIFGLDDVSLDECGWKLNVAYDASRTCIDCVEEALVNNGVQLKDNWWTRFKREHYKFVDQNVKDNANQEPWSCH